MDGESGDDEDVSKGWDGAIIACVEDMLGMGNDSGAECDVGCSQNFNKRNVILTLVLEEVSATIECWKKFCELLLIQNITMPQIK